MIDHLLMDLKPPSSVDHPDRSSGTIPLHRMPVDAQELFVSLHGVHSFSMKGGGNALEPCKCGALIPTHQVELGAHAQGDS